MTTPVTPSKVRCTYFGCIRTFDSVRDMKRHKILEPDHEYCQACDKDFEDEERLLVHKIKSNKHIVCPICGVDFRSEGGRDGHIRQNHRSLQNITCHGCKERFGSASSMVRHIEADECPSITHFSLLKERSKKLMIKEALKGGEGSPLPVIADPTDDDGDDFDGGVKIQSLEEKNREAMMNQPFGVKASDDAHASANLATQHWPALSASIKISDNGLPLDLMSFSRLEISSPQDNASAIWKGKARAAGTILAGESVSGNRPFGLDSLNAGQALRILDENWDSVNFLNSFSGEYVCSCDAAFTSREAFEEHVLRKSRSNRSVECPRCHRKFKTTAALIAHCESPSTRCGISDGEMYGQIINELTGGVIQTAGYNPDGTVRYEAGKIDLPKTTTVGVNLRDVKRNW